MYLKCTSFLLKCAVVAAVATIGAGCNKQNDATENLNAAATATKEAGQSLGEAASSLGQAAAAGARIAGRNLELGFDELKADMSKSVSEVRTKMGEWEAESEARGEQLSEEIQSQWEGVKTQAAKAEAAIAELPAEVNDAGVAARRAADEAIVDLERKWGDFMHAIEQAAGG